ncbi:MAG: Fe-S cluster assembly protein SufD [bacterium]|nr:Fe-S cluster assembly protein SufD [bacterium]
MTQGKAYASLLQLFEERKKVNSRGPAWLEQLRAEARSAFEESGLPTPQSEDWRFTDLAKLSDLELHPAEEAPVLASEWVESTRKAAGPEHRVVFAQDVFQAELSRLGNLPAGVRVASLAKILREEPERLKGRLGTLADLKRTPLSALNTALFRDGVLIEIADDVSVSEAIHLVFVQTGGDRHLAIHPRVLVVAGGGSRATVVEHFIGETPHNGLTNPLTELLVGENAHIDHVALQERRTGSFHLANLFAKQQAGSRFASHSIAMGEGLSRLEIRTSLEGEGAHAQLNGLYMARDRQLVDHHTTIDHATPHTTSSELYKGILDGRGRGVFHGRIHVRPDAQKADAAQTNRALLLSDSASLNTKPQLEIYADDVKCSHGASIGELDPDQLFYMRSRGMSLEDARSALTFAFASDVINALPLEALRNYLKYSVLKWLPRGTHA